MATNPFKIISSSEKKPHDLSPIGMHHVKITAEVPGYTSLTRTLELSIITINPLSLSLILSLIIIPVFVYYRKKRRIIIRDSGKNIPAPGQPAITTNPPTSTIPLLNLTGIKGRVLSAYHNGLAAAEAITGIIMTPSTTLREFMKQAPFSSPNTAARFTELTTIAESSLYSSDNPPDFVATRAEELAESIREEL
jgi:hypothetical protein